MMKKCLVICIIFISLQINAQDSLSIKNIQTQDPLVIDTSVWAVKEKIDLGKNTQSKSIDKEIFKPDPNKALIYSAIFPGLGQVYNKKYWKLPIIYSGFLALSYAISWNGGYYRDYSNGYRAISGNNPMERFDEWGHLVPNRRPEDITDDLIASYTSAFRRKRDFYRRNRDLSIIGAVALYAACMIDAYVDAHLFDFDVSPDLSLRVEPVVMSSFSVQTKQSFGIQCSVKF